MVEQDSLKKRMEDVNSVIEKDKNIFRNYTVNPTLELVGSLLNETKRSVRTIKTRVAKVEGKMTKLSVDERQHILEDNSKFIKVFLDSGALLDFITLSKTAQKILVHIIENIEYNKDFVYVYNYKLIKEIGLGATSVSLGKKELLENQWIFNSEDNNKYWINLCYICLGDREEIYRRFRQTGN